jgi:pimeloyl-ACP methyl ester carboxylesterase
MVSSAPRGQSEPNVREFSSNGVRIAFVDVPARGQDRQQPILLIHGFASTHAINWVNPRWVDTLTGAGRRVVAFDNRGHGQSEKPHAPEAYHSATMAQDALNLLDFLDIPRADAMGYSMGARIAAFLTLENPARVRALILGGLGDHLVDGVGLPLGIARAMETPALADLTDPTERMFRKFADQNGGDRVALAACIRGSRQTLSREQVARIGCPTLVASGTSDAIAGDPRALAAMLPHGEALDIPGRDHNLAVGDKVFKAGVVAFLDRRA